MEKIEEFLFDILGLIVPGLVCITLVVLLPMSVIDYSRVDFSEYLVGRTPLVIYFNRIMDKVTLGAFLSSWQVLTVIVAISYILGHTIKVLSKYQYELCEKIFDKGLNRLVGYFVEELNIKAGKNKRRIIRIVNSKYRKRIGKIKTWWIPLIGIPFGITEFTVKVCKAIFNFGAANNYEKKIEKEVGKILHRRYNVLTEDWYTIYKIANVVIAQENLKALAFKYLAKYNFYRSLALIFLLNGFYIIVLYKMVSHIINPLGNILFCPILIINFILWFTFHEKYKRYWTLCGNDSLLTLFYFLNTKGGVKGNV